MISRTITKNKVIVAAHGANSPAAQWQNGHVEIVRANWNKDFLDECDAFPTPRIHDDQIDAMCGGIRALPDQAKPDYTKGGLSGKFKEIRKNKPGSNR
jgi:hypothetical protein